MTYSDCGLASSDGRAVDVGAVTGGELGVEVFWRHCGLDDYVLWREGRKAEFMRIMDDNVLQVKKEQSRILIKKVNEVWMTRLSLYCVLWRGIIRKKM